MIDEFFAAIQKACLPAVWSRGIALSRDGSVFEDARRDGEILLRVVLPNRPVSPKITLWPEEEDWYCDCGDRNDPCLHVAAAVAALKNGTARAPEAQAVSGGARVEYRFVRAGGRLQFQRWIGAHRLAGTLVSHVAGIASGRIAASPVAATREDYGVDQALGTDPREELEPAALLRLLTALHDLPGITLDGAPVSVVSRPVSAKLVLEDEGRSFRLHEVRDALADEAFANGAELCAGMLRPARAAGISFALREWIGRTYGEQEAGALASEILPRFETEEVPVEILTRRLPRLITIEPRVVLRMDQAGDALGVAAEIVYGDPPIAELREGRFVSLTNDRVARRDLAAESRLVQKLRTELQLAPGNRVRFEGREAREFAAKARGWNAPGAAARAFEVAGQLTASVTIGADGSFGTRFEVAGSGEADAKAVFEAWRRGDDAVPLLGGGWAALPRDWLEKFGERAARLLLARDARSRIPILRQPELARFAEDLGDPVPDTLAGLRARLEGTAPPPESALPADLAASLRGYQLHGVRWLAYLRELGLGALLADDMGLGKTLQALCALKGRALVIAPTSVVHAWAEQARKFRPKLRMSVYHGASRALDPSAEVTLTTYGILRLDHAELAAVEWDCVVLDEAQNIKTASSQVARAAHQLRGGFRLALTGTPVENRLEDIQSIFRFVNPGLLADDAGIEETRRLVRPFLMRRLKRDVAPELPPRTEITLVCELSDGERANYDAILAATRTEILDKLGGGGSVIAVLEALLRLRQACCHPSLVPGAPEAETSSKLEVLAELLEQSSEEGHRTLVFSQWTSLLDRVETRLARSGLRWLRLDGSTRDREGIVSAFQAGDGPPVLLVSLKAGGTGLTLTAADHVVLLDPWWNPFVEDQAADRAHRIGQERPVFIHRLVAQGTVEERILELQMRKREVADAVLAGGSGGASVTREELIQLLT